MSVLELTDSEKETLLFCLHQSKIDAEGMHAIGVGNKQTVNDINKMIHKTKENSISWKSVISLLQNQKHRKRFDINDDNEIICKNEKDAMCIADFLEALGFNDVHVSLDKYGMCTKVISFF